MPSEARVGAANGRVYDPLTAQIFSPDPYVQAPDNWLNYNRYAYAYGNPFKYTDPSGKMPWYFAALIVTGLMYLKTAHDMTPLGKDKGHPKNWQWNPIKWFETQPGKPKPAVIFGYSSRLDGSSTTIGFSIGNPGEPMPTVVYSKNYGWGMGYNQAGQSNLYYPGYNPNAAEQAVVKAEQNAKINYYQIINPINSTIGVVASINATSIYDPNIFGKGGTWKAKNGNIYDFELISSKGKGWKIYESSRNIAKNRAFYPRIIGNSLGVATTVFAINNYMNERTTDNFIGILESGVGILYWTYALGDSYFRFMYDDFIPGTVYPH